MSLSFPFLRPPPFPKANISLTDFVRPISRPEKILTDNDIQNLIEKLLQRRVGGNFWAAPLPKNPQKQSVLLIEDLTDEAFFLAIAKQGDLVILPDHQDYAELAESFKKQGCMIYSGLFDPWSLLDQATEIIASGKTALTIDIGLIARLGHIPLSFSPTARKFFSDIFTSPDVIILALVRQQLTSFQYNDIFTGQPISLDQAITQLSEWRSLIDSNRAIKAACGIAWWKKEAIRRFLWSGEKKRLPMPQKTETALSFLKQKQEAIALWPSREPKGLRKAIAQKEAQLYEVEDGFIRSVGLGSGLHPPLSIVVDKQGIYYDPNQPSDIETLFNETVFSQELLERAQKLIARIQSAHISKYMGTGADKALNFPKNKRIILVTGQVEDDRSVRLGGGAVKGNLDLLKRARENEADSYIIFKPHPDVEAGHRKGFVPQESAEKYADIIIRDYPITRLFDQVDAVHVWTSLAGFEALLRHREVICHGTPFYAGWGLTRDLGAIPARRKRKLDITELAAVTLILYPRYLDPVTGMPCSPEVLIERLIQSPKAKMTPVTWIRHFQGKICAAFRQVMINNPLSGKS
ncbi:capsular biosynthesis protein [Zymomonas mobilis]|uniref:capsular polysaccharide export protein, LipB/KpsS family n=1 Tax=Zymomonas mobilis TaxID=542 RepID=UPI0039EC56F2